MPTMKKQIPSLRRKKFFSAKAHGAFSLVELLVVIAVIGIIAAIAIPNIGNLTGSADEAKDRRNAQTLASLSSAAMAAGYVPTGASGTAQLALFTNAAGVVGKIDGAAFRLDLGAAEYDTAKKYLNYSTNVGFSYVKDGTGTAD